VLDPEHLGRGEMYRILNQEGEIEGIRGAGPYDEAALFGRDPALGVVMSLRAQVPGRHSGASVVDFDSIRGREGLCNPLVTSKYAPSSSVAGSARAGAAIAHPTRIPAGRRCSCSRRGRARLEPPTTARQRRSYRRTLRTTTFGSSEFRAAMKRWEGVFGEGLGPDPVGEVPCPAK
jgi:hypothetical protein